MIYVCLFWLFYLSVVLPNIYLNIETIIAIYLLKPAKIGIHQNRYMKFGHFEHFGHSCPKIQVEPALKAPKLGAQSDRGTPPMFWLVDSSHVIHILCSDWLTVVIRACSQNCNDFSGFSGHFSGFSGHFLVKIFDFSGPTHVNFL